MSQHYRYNTFHHYRLLVHSIITDYIPSSHITFHHYRLHSFVTDYIPSLKITFHQYKLHSFITDYIPSLQINSPKKNIMQRQQQMILQNDIPHLSLLICARITTQTGYSFTSNQPWIWDVVVDVLGNKLPDCFKCSEKFDEKKKCHILTLKFLHQKKKHYIPVKI